MTLIQQALASRSIQSLPPTISVTTSAVSVSRWILLVAQLLDQNPKSFLKDWDALQGASIEFSVSPPSGFKPYLLHNS